MLERPFDGARRALAAEVATFKVAVELLLAGGVTGFPVKPQVGPSVIAGETAQARVTAELKLLVEVTVIVALDRTPGLPDGLESAPLVMVKLPLLAPVEYAATKASTEPPPKVDCSAFTTGKPPAVLPAT